MRVSTNIYVLLHATVLAVENVSTYIYAVVDFRKYYFLVFISMFSVIYCFMNLHINICHKKLLQQPPILAVEAEEAVDI